MRKEINKALKGSEKFEDGLLRTDACMERHLGSRACECRTNLEDLPERSFGSSALREERRLMRDVYKLAAKGFKPNGFETLESFVEKHIEDLEEGE